MKAPLCRVVPFAACLLLLSSIGCSPNNSGSNSTPPPVAPAVSTLSPTSIVAGSLGKTLTVTGSNFVPGSEITWNGTERATLYVSSTSLQMALLPGDLSSATTAQVGVTDPPDAGGLSSGTLPFSVSASPIPNPIPVLTSLTPLSVQVGSSQTSITLNGGNFVTGSIVTWNGQAVTSSYQSSSILTVQIPAADVAAAGTAQIAVVNPSPGGGTSTSLTLMINAVGASGLTVVNVPANDLAWDAVNQSIYLSLPSLAGTNGNAVQALNPVTGALGTSTFAGSEPNLLSVSSSSKYLYASLDGGASVQRFALPGLTPDISIPLGADSFDGPYVALDLQASPVADGTVAVVRGTPGISPEEEGGVQIYDNAVARPNALCGFIEIGCSGTGGDLFNSIQWNSTGTEMFALNTEDTGFDFYTVPVTASGFGTVKDYGGVASGFSEGFHYDSTTQLLYTDGGTIINPVDGTKVGQFNASGIAVPDGANGVIFFIGQQSGAINGTYTIESFDINRYTPIGTLAVQDVVGTPTHMIRWGSNGLAFTSESNNISSTAPTGQVYLVSGSFVSTKSREPGAPVAKDVHRTWTAHSSKSIPKQK
ncbi:hypothetical protein FTO74_07155 [Granulicella sp. WH15]|uniref:IPT/TIG domain-containing protein n=1 Tax=Granulicella sp. WH15 TaxID=2602070 RepID=UPI001366B55F|nr:IPT/TIG domain-containing protein [Granulicella sp. WH15]QHN03171.1 hypothetical protein FTO74_07155 [Granulicella sp. WH15]